MPCLRQKKRSNLHALRVVMLLFITVVVRSPILAQDHSALLMGTVSDPAGRPTCGVQIFVVGEENAIQRHEVTDIDGSFFVPELPRGVYMLEAYSDGFATFQLKGIRLRPGDRKVIEIHFVLTRPYTTVRVFGKTADPTTLVTTVDQNLVQNLPTPGRSFPTLFLLTPGVVLMPAQQSLSNDREFSFDGQPTNANYYTVDGVTTNTAVGFNGDELDLAQNVNYGVAGTTMDILPTDAIQSIRVRAGLLPSTLGRQTGANIAITSRSGSSHYHGTASEYFQNSALDASDWFTNHANLPQTQLNQNDFGLTISGPLHLGNEPNRFSNFFFFAFEGFRSLEPTIFNTDVPSMSLRRQAPTALHSYLDIFPRPNGPENTPAHTATYTVNSSLPASSNAFSLRIDSLRRDNLAFFIRYSNSPSRIVSTWTGWNLSTSENRSQGLTSGATWTLGRHTTDNLIANIAKDIGSTSDAISPGGHSSSLPIDILLPNYSWQSKSYSATYAFLDSDYTVASPAINSVRQINIVNNFVTIRGHHAFTVGGDWLSQLGDTLPDRTTLLVDYLSPASIKSGIADFVYVAAQDHVRLVQHDLSLYWQDAWRVNHRLTADYGLRWEFNPAPRAINGQHLFSVSDTNTITLANEKAPLYPTSYTDLAPRMGFSYLLRSNVEHSLLLRAGLGVGYSLNNTSSMYDTSTFPHVSQIGALKLAFPSKAVTLSYPSPPKLNPPFDGQFFQGYTARYAAPKVYQWNVGIQQFFTSNQYVDVSYVGSIGRRLYVQQSFVDPNSSFIDQSLVSINRSDAHSSYNSLQIQYKHRLSRSLEVLASYTWAHSRDDTSQDIPVTSGSNLISLNGEYGDSDFDLRDSLGTAFTYEFPSITVDGWLRGLLQRWDISGFAWTRSGMPVDVTYNDWVAGLPFPLRPDIVPGHRIYIRRRWLPGGEELNPHAFAVLSGGHQGTLRRNSIRGLPFWQVDLGIRREISLARNVNFQWSGEFINALNHPNFGDPDSSLGDFEDGELSRDSSFGRVTSMLDNTLGGHGPQREFQLGGQRSVQLGIRISF